MKFDIIKEKENYRIIEKIDNYTFMLGETFYSIEEAENYITDYQKKLDQKIEDRAKNFWSSLKK